MRRGGGPGAAGGVRSFASSNGSSNPAPAALAARFAEGCEACLCLAALLYFPLLVLVPRAIAALAAAAALASLVLLFAKRGGSAAAACFGFPAGLILALVGWGAVSAAWSPAPWRSVVQGAALSGLILGALAMPAAAVVTAPRRLAGFLRAGFVGALAMALFDLASGGALSKPFFDRVYQPAWFNQAADGFAILLLPSAAALRRRPSAALFAAAGALTVLVLDGTAAKVALLVGLAVAAASWRRRVMVARIAAVVTVLAVATAPLSFGRLEQIASVVRTADWVKASAGHRLLIWSFVADRIAEHPLRGWGLDSSRAIPGGRDPIGPGETWLPLHPHNAPLQVWLELGAPGAIALALLCGWFWLALAAAPWPPPYAAAAAGSLAAACAAAVATYGVWQEWWLGTLSFAMFMVLVMARLAPAPPEPG